MKRSSFVRILSVLGGVLLTSLLSPDTAKAQNRGTLQATATVIESRPALAALQAAKTITSNWLANRAPAANDDVSTVAQVTIKQSTDSRRLVVTIDYSKN